MSKKPNRDRSGAKLGDTKGAQVLGELAAAFAAKRKPASVPRPPARTVGIEEELLQRGRERPVNQAPARQPPKTKKTKNEPIKVKISKEDRRRIYGQDENSGSTVPAITPIINDMGKAAFNKIARLRPALQNFLADHRAPSCADANATKLVSRRIVTCVADFERIVDPDSDGFIGYDFGTSSTKAVVRWPYRANSPAYAVPVPDGWCSGGQPHIWPSVVFFDPQSQRFSLLPAEDHVQMDGFKAALVENASHRMIPGTSVTFLEASVAFLALHLAYVLGAVAELPDGRVNLVNFAIPVAALDSNGKNRAQQVFECAVRAALSLLRQSDALHLDAVRNALADPVESSLEYELHPELSGVMAGYCKGPRHHVGSHMIIDCGSATLDMATFKLDATDWPLEIYAASVELLGSDASDAYCRAGAGIEDCVGAARYQDHLVCARSIAVNRTGFTQTADRKFSYQVILAGGGIDSPWISQMLARWQSSFHRSFKRPVLDAGLRCEPGYAPERLVLADGLARDPVDLKRVSPPAKLSPGRKFGPSDHDWTSN